MKNVTLLRQLIDMALAEYCTGMDDHSSPHCEKCSEMNDAIVEAVENWRVRAYKTTKGKI